MKLNVLRRARVYCMHRVTVLSVKEMEKTLKLQGVFCIVLICKPPTIKTSKEISGLMLIDQNTTVAD